MSVRRWALAALALAVAAGCEMERRVVAVRGSLGSIPGAEGGARPESRARPVNPGAAEGAAMLRDPLNNPVGYATPPGMNNELRVPATEPGALDTLVSRNPRELIYHLRAALLNDERELLLEQILSRRTRERYEDLGRDPREAVDFLFERREQMLRLLAQIPMGDMTPGVFARTIGPSEFRIEIPRETADPGLRFRVFEYVYERDGCRLLLIR